jgi:outer membrane protein assembly factor BamA
VRARSLLGLGLAFACSRTPEVRSPVLTVCAANWIGQITVEGAKSPQLAVLEGTLDDPARTDRIVTTALAALRVRGYLTAAITVDRERGCGIELHAHVTLGPRFTITSIEFETDDEFPAATRLALIEDALGTVNTIGGTYVQERLERALVELRKRYADAGWLDAQISAPVASHDANGNVTVSIPVTAGPRFRIGSVRAVGGGTANRDVIAALGLREGEYYDRTVVRAGIERARRHQP